MTTVALTADALAAHATTSAGLAVDHTHTTAAAAMTSSLSSPPIDPHGNCAHHPFVQLRRLSPRTNEWKALLDSCPLCAMDTRSVCSGSASACSSVCSGLEVERRSGGGSRRDSDTSGGGGSRSPSRGRSRAPSLEHALATLDPRGRPSRNHQPPQRARSTSRVRFGAAHDSESTLNGLGPILARSPSITSMASHASNVSTLTKSALKPPKFKACPVALARNLDESERVTTMSMDLDMSMNEDNEVVIPGEEELYPDGYGYEDFGAEEFGEEKKESEGEGEVETVEAEEEESVLIEAQEEKVELELAGPPSATNASEPAELPEESDSESESPAHLLALASHGSSSSRRHGRSTERRSSASKANGATNDRSKPRRSASCQVGRRSHHDAPAPGGQVSHGQVSLLAVARPDPEEFPCHASQSSRDHTQPRRNGRPKRASSRQVRGGSFSQRGTSLPPPPPPANGNGATTRYGSTVLVASPEYDDEVSTLTFASNNGPTNGPASAAPGLATIESANNNSFGTKYGLLDSDAALAGEESLQEFDAGVPRIDTNDYDRRGRCVHHPHVRLRKKKLFRRGWKVLMSACPDCCVDELRRIRLVEDNKRRMAAKKEKHARQKEAERRESVGSAVERSERSAASQEGRSGRQSLGRRQSSSGSVRSNGSRTGAPHVAALLPPPPPPRPAAHHRSRSQPPARRSPSVDSTSRSVRSVLSASRSAISNSRVLKSGMNAAKRDLRRPSSDETASLTGSSSGSSRELVDASLRGSIDASVRSSIDASIKSAGSMPPPRLDRAARSLQRHHQAHNPHAAAPHEDRRHRRRSSKSRERRAGRRDSSLSSRQSASSAALHSVTAPRGSPQGTLHVRKMRWTDGKGRPGAYSGQVDALFAPHGKGAMEYDDGRAKEGEWKHGRCRRGASEGGSVTSGRSGRSGRSKSKEGRRARSLSRSVQSLQPLQPLQSLPPLQGVMAQAAF